MRVTRSRVQSEGIYVTFKCEYEINIFSNGDVIACDAGKSVKLSMQPGTDVQFKGRSNSKVYKNNTVPAQYTAEYGVVPIKLHITLLHESDIDVYIGGVYFTKCFATLEEKK